MSLLIANAMWAAAAVGVNVWAVVASRRHLSPTRVALRIASTFRAVGAASFLALYLAELTGVVSFLERARVQRWVALGVWPLVWCYPALAALTSRPLTSVEVVEAVVAAVVPDEAP